MIQFISWFLAIAGYIFMFAGVVLVLVALIRPINMRRLHCEPRIPPSYWLLSFGVAFIVLHYLDPHRLVSPNIEGRWMYEVTNGDGVFSHMGECTIVRRGDQVHLGGTRRWTCRYVDGSPQCVAVKSSWSSDWAQVCHDGGLRFEYKIDLHEGRLRGYCLVTLRDGGKKMVGHYYLLPPFDPQILNAQFGEIVFTRLGRDQEIPAPTSDQILTLPQRLRVDATSEGNQK